MKKQYYIIKDELNNTNARVKREYKFVFDKGEEKANKKKLKAFHLYVEAPKINKENVMM